jgi:dTDP-glucose pyrophosphorylase
MITPSCSVRVAMVRLGQTAKNCLFVVDGEGVVIGTLTDGDLRRGILKGIDLDSPIDGLFNTNPIVVYESDNPEDSARRLLALHKIDIVPVLDTTGRMISHLTWEDVFAEAQRTTELPLNTAVVIMAGGVGSRLEPFTKVLPKPLIPVNDIIDRFVERGVNDFWLTVNYKSRIMKAYFEDRNPEYRLKFIEEPEPMGTAGSLQFVKGLVRESFFVTNCDVIIDADYRSILEFHKDGGHAITLVGSTVHYQIPYGTCVLNSSGTLDRIDEKPAYDFLVNTGMYILDPHVLDLIPRSGIFHTTHLIKAAVDEGHSVGVFPVGEDAWIDVGQWREYQRATERL